MDNSKVWYQSSTMRNSIVGAVVSIATLGTALTGKALDVALIQEYLNQGWALIPLAITAYTSIKSAMGRKNATSTIGKK